MAIVRPSQGAPVAAVELWYRAPSTGFEGKAQPSIARLAAQAVAASKPILGDPLGKVVRDAGGRLAITVYTDSVEISALVPSANARTVVKAMTTAYFAPVTTEEGYRSAQRDVSQEALFSPFDVETVVRDAVFSQLFTDGPQHYPTIGDPKGIDALTYTAVKDFAVRAFRSQNATLVISGAVDSTITTAAVAGRSDQLAAEPPTPGQVAAVPGPVSKSFVQPSGGYGWIGPAIASEREATAMDFIADYLFRTDSGFVAKSVAEVNPDSVLVGQFITLHDPGVMFVAYSGKETDAIKALVDAGFSAIQKPLPAADFKPALAAFEYHLLSDLQTPIQLADNFGWYSVEGAPAYAPGANGENGAYFDAAKSLTPAFVASVAQKYLGKQPTVITLTPPDPAAQK
jgi:predicted Zn-dependent peptidase